MFDKFGEFDSVEELNLAAAGFKAEGDMDSLFALAEENGIEKEDAQDYADGLTDELATLALAASGRIDVEEKEGGGKGTQKGMAMSIIYLMLRGMCMDPDMQKAVLKKGRRAEDIFAAMKDAAEKHKNGGVGICCGTDRQLKELIRSYYLENEEDFVKKMESMYQ